MYAKSVTEDDKLLFGVSRMFAARGVPREQLSQGRGPEHAHTKSEKPTIHPLSFHLNCSKGNLFRV